MRRARTAAWAALLTVGLSCVPAPAHAGQPTVEVGDVVATVVEGGAETMRVFPVDEHGSRAAALRAASATPGVVDVAIDVPVRAAALGDDTRRAEQWALDTLATETLPRATTAAGGVLVAVLDTGVAAAHSDWAAGTVRCDLGADFSTGALDAVTRQPVSTGNGCTDPNGHGTHVAGIVAAARGNAQGVAGLTDAQVMPVRVLGSAGGGTAVAVAAGIRWAVDHGARVVNLSLGGPASGAYDSAVAYALEHDVLVVAAAGNNRQGGNAENYPAALPAVVSVAALGRDGVSTSFSHTSPTVDLAAPGDHLLSLWPSGYASASGTSMASPVVAAVAAMYRAAHPAADTAAVSAALTRTALDAEAPGRDDATGAGRVDPVALLTGARQAPPSTPTGLVATSRLGAVALSWDAVGTESGPVTAYRLEVDGVPRPSTSARSVVVDLPDLDPHRFRVVAEGPGGQSAPTAETLAHAVGLPPAVGPVAAATDGERVTLTWQAPAGTPQRPVSGFRVYRDGALVGQPAQPTFEAAAPAAGGAHGYQVAASSDVGEGPRSAVQVTAPAPEPPPPAPAPAPEPPPPAPAPAPAAPPPAPVAPAPAPDAPGPVGPGPVAPAPVSPVVPAPVAPAPPLAEPLRRPAPLLAVTGAARGSALVTAQAMAPRSLVTVRARYSEATRQRVGRRVVTRTVVRTVTLHTVRTDVGGSAEAVVRLPAGADAVRVVVTGTRPGGAHATTSALLRVR